VLDAVADVLRMGSAERWHLYRLADVPGVPKVAGEPAPLPSEVLPVLDALEPNPACIYSGKYDLLAANESYAALFPMLVHAGGHARNALWQLFTMDPSQPLCNLELLPHMVAVARANYARHVGEAEWDEWIARMCAVSADFDALWATHAVAEPVPQVKSFQAFDLGLVNVRTTSFALPGQSENRMVVYLPLTAADAGTIDQLRARMPRRLQPAQPA
jgi:hypothetical protein